MAHKLVRMKDQQKKIVKEAVAEIVDEAVDKVIEEATKESVDLTEEVQKPASLTVNLDPVKKKRKRRTKAQIKADNEKKAENI